MLKLTITLCLRLLGVTVLAMGLIIWFGSKGVTDWSSVVDFLFGLVMLVFAAFVLVMEVETH